MVAPCETTRTACPTKSITEPAPMAIDLEQGRHCRFRCIRWFGRMLIPQIYLRPIDFRIIFAFAAANFSLNPPKS